MKTEIGMNEMGRREELDTKVGGMVEEDGKNRGKMKEAGGRMESW